jgi:hypothetical protein
MNDEAGRYGRRRRAVFQIMIVYFAGQTEGSQEKHKTKTTGTNKNTKLKLPVQIKTHPLSLSNRDETC